MPTICLLSHTITALIKGHTNMVVVIQKKNYQVNAFVPVVVICHRNWEYHQCLTVDFRQSLHLNQRPELFAADKQKLQHKITA